LKNIEKSYNDCNFSACTESEVLNFMMFGTERDVTLWVLCLDG